MTNNLKRVENYFLVIVASFIALFFFAQATFLSNDTVEDSDAFIEQEREEEYQFYRGEVVKVLDEQKDHQIDFIHQRLLVRIISGDRKGEDIEISNSAYFVAEEAQRFTEGDKIVLSIYNDSVEEDILINDHYRINSLIVIFLIFLSLVFYFGRKRGVGSVLGLVFSMIVLIYYMIPNIISGTSPLQVTLIGTIIITTVSLFLAHGINKRTPIIWLSNVATLFLSIIAAYLFVDLANLFGGGSDISTIFQLGQFPNINLRGLLLTGMIVGVLGVLSDVTSTQTRVIWQLKKANPKYGARELYESSLAVGREHIASLVNTLGLVYVGASLPLIILLKAADYVPLWVTINREPLAEELVRIIIGSTSLILAVPISSFLAAYFISKLKDDDFKE